MGCQAYKCFPLLGKLLIDWELEQAPVMEIKKKVKLSEAEKELAAKYQKRYIEKGRKAPVEPNKDDFDEDDEFEDAMEKYEDYLQMKKCYESLSSYTSEESNELTHRALIIAISNYIKSTADLLDDQVEILDLVIEANTENDDSKLIAKQLITPKAAPKPKAKEEPVTTPAPAAPKAD